MEKKDDHGDGVVDVRTGATNLHKQINAMEYQIQNARATLEQLQEEQLVVKKNFNRLLEEFSHGGDGSTANLENELGFKISQVPELSGRRKSWEENSKKIPRRERARAKRGFGTGIMSPENAEDVAYEASIKRREINQVFQKVVNQILHLESIGSSISCPEEWLIVAKDLAMSLENRLVDYKKGLYEINEKIRELADEFFPYWIEAEEEKVKEFSYRINTQVYGLWVVNDDDDSEEASKQASKRRKGSDYR
ncbi:hypothetical protein FNV43_RR07233 [Rhamnella rubrinervis]|uniref:Uncharacterized protein n=1 Tax=Rhamnella rubrinervis TaxID=2594499 RepID=A0A8K0HEE4_9ROSA|nr:hypothetical protein FNV43_RR07233 [Rhamnella rubrinervis]